MERADHLASEDSRRSHVFSAGIRLVSGAMFGVAGFVETLEGMAALSPVRAIAGLGSVALARMILESGDSGTQHSN